MTQKEWLDAFAANLKSMMTKYGYTQHMLAHDANLNQSTICKYLAMKQTPSIKAIMNIANVFGCSIGDLIDFGERIE